MKQQTSILFLALLVVIWVASCEAPGTESPPQTASSPTAVSIPTPYHNNLIIRIDSVTILKDDGHGGQGGGVYFVLLAVRGQGDSAKLILPGKDSYQAKVGQTIELGQFSLAINNVRYSEGEQIAFYILGLQSNEQNPRDEALTDLAVNAAIEAARLLLARHSAVVSLVSFLLENLSGPALDFWRQEKVLGEYSDMLGPENNWLAGKQYHVLSANQNLDFRFTVLQNVDLLGTEPRDSVLLTVVNNSSVPAEALYISLHDCPDKNAYECRWGPNVLAQSIPPGGSQQFKIGVGVYDLRAEGARGALWEMAALDLTSDQKWTITNNQ